MSPAAKKEAIVLILDIRRGPAEKFVADQTFSNVKECAKKIVVRKIIAKSTDHIAVVLLGSETTNNVGEAAISYDNISVMSELQVPSWEMLADIWDGVESPTDCGGDILESFIVALSLLRDRRYEYSSQQIVLLSTACGSGNPDGVDVVLGGLKATDVQVTVIGPNVAEYSQDMEDAKVEMDDLPPEQGIVVRFALETDGLVCRFEDALGHLTKFERRKVKGVPWKVQLDVGPNIKIPVFGLIKTSPSEDIKTKVQLVNQTNGTPVARDYVFTATTAKSMDEEPVEKEDVIEGYNFGATIVPFSADEKAALGYHSGPKCLSVLLFTKASDVPRHLLIGNGTYHFFPADDPCAKKAFSALLHAMEERNVVAVVRKIYNSGNAPTIGVLSPRIEEEYTCFEYVTLPFADDVKHFSFAPLTSKKSTPSAEQLDVVDKLITSMNLMEVEDEDEGEAFRPEDTVDPVQQYLYEVICERALRPGKGVMMPSDNFRRMLAPPIEVMERCRPILDKVKELFPLQEVKPREGTRKAAADVFKQESVDPLAASTSRDVKSDSKEEVKAQDPLKAIGTLAPVDDFQRMLDEKHIPFGEVCAQMQAMIWKFVESAFDLDDMKKTVLSVKAMRNACIKENPSTYNAWLLRLKGELPPSKKSFWTLVVEDRLTLITSDESALSTVSPEDAEDLIREKTEAMEEEPEVDHSLDDLVNDM